MNKWTRTSVHTGRLYEYQGQYMQRALLEKMKNDLCYFAEKHRAPLVPTPAQLYMMKAIMEQYEKTGEVKVVVKKR